MVLYLSTAWASEAGFQLGSTEETRIIFFNNAPCLNGFILKYHVSLNLKILKVWRETITMSKRVRKVTLEFERVNSSVLR